MTKAKRSEDAQAPQDAPSAAGQDDGRICGDEAPAAPPAAPDKALESASDPRAKLLAGLVIARGGKPIDGLPTADNYAVSPAPGTPFTGNQAATCQALAAAFPGCVFTFVAR